MVPKSQNHFEDRIMFFQVSILKTKNRFPCVKFLKWLYTLVKKLKIAKNALHIDMEIFTDTQKSSYEKKL